MRIWWPSHKAARLLKEDNEMTIYDVLVYELGMTSEEAQEIIAELEENER